MIRAVSALLVCSVASSLAPRQQSATRPPVPLAFVRRVDVAPVKLAIPPDIPLPPAPPIQDKKRRAEWEVRSRARRDFGRLRSEAAASMRDAVVREIVRAAGLMVADSARPAEPIAARIGRATLPRPLPAAATYARSAGADAALVLIADRFGVNTGLERELWLRVAGYIAMADGEVRGPFFAVGRARAGRKFFGFGKGFDRTDADLGRSAASQAAHRLVVTLVTGVEMPFARDCRVAILPALVPNAVEKRFGAADGPNAARTPIVMHISALERFSDVLFQPDVGPAADVIERDAVSDALRDLRESPESAWESGAALAARTKEASQRLEADYVFVSRIAHIDLSEEPADVRDTDRPAPGVARRCDIEVEGALYSTVAGKIVWRDRAEGGTIATTEYVRHQPRIRTDEQCVLDAARTAYAHLSFSFASYMRRFDR